MSRPPVLVLKFGGTSVSTPERRARVVEHVRRARRDGNRVAIVVSAMGRAGDPYATDTLLDLLRRDGPVDPHEYDLMFTCGEAIAVAVMAHALKREGIDAVGLTSAQARIYTDGHHVESEIVRIDTGRLRELLAADRVPVITGGQGVEERTLDFTTLGRGGSDTSAVAVGVALDAARVEIFTDVEGISVTDPRLVPGAPLLPVVSFPAMLELARFGARVMHPRAIAAGWKGRTPLVVRSTFSDAPGTRIDDVADAAPLVGLTWLGAMETTVLPPGSVDEGTRRRWESRHLIMTLTDEPTGGLIVGASADKRADLEVALAGCPAAPLRREGSCAWISMVGEAGALQEALASSLALLARSGVGVTGCEAGSRRCTVVVPEAERERAARLLYQEHWGQD